MDNDFYFIKSVSILGVIFPEILLRMDQKLFLYSYERLRKSGTPFLVDISSTERSRMAIKSETLKNLASSI